MSPRGEPESDESRLPRSRAYGSVEPSIATGAEVLPLRLSVARGDLGIELVQPLSVGPLICEQLDIALLGLRYPVDLSKGVKQFKGRRSQLREATVLVDLQALAHLWELLVQELWGEPVAIRIAVGAATGVTASSANTNHTIDSLSVCVHSDSGVLAFDLVVASGSEPRFIVDMTRSHGSLAFLRGKSALRAAIQILEAGLSGGAAGLSLSRSGRSISVAGLARALCLALLPELGFRLPQVGSHVISGIEVSLGRLRCRLSQLAEPFPAGFRALQLSSSAEFFVRADEQLAQDNLDEARRLYLEALDISPNHADLLLELAELDLAHGGRAEAAISFLEEMKPDQGTPVQVRMRHLFLLGKAMHLTGRSVLADELWAESIKYEHDPVFVAHLLCDLASRAKEPDRVNDFVERAVTRAPHLHLVRMTRFRHALRRGDRRVALGESEQLEASLVNLADRSRLLYEFSLLFGENGMEDEAISCLRSSLRLVPDDPKVMVELGKRLYLARESIRAGELFSAALRRLALALQSTQPAALRTDSEEHAEHLELAHQCHHSLAHILKMDLSGSAEVLLHLGAIPTRSAFGAEARLMESEIFHDQGNSRDRDHAFSRFVEAGQLGWIDLSSCVKRVETNLETFATSMDNALLQSARELIERLR